MNRPLSSLCLALGLATAACASAGPPRAPSEIPAEFVHFVAATVAPGDVAPDFTLSRVDDAGTVTLSELRGKPVVLVFGSFT